MTATDLIVVGASAGGVEALRELVSGLPSRFPAAICVVLHIPSAGPSVLDRILARAGPLVARVASDGEPIRRGRIYVAAPDHHLVVHRGHLRLVRGPRENGYRPAIDVLFRSAARAYGAAVAGVVLTGNLGDGALGLRAVKEQGGVAIVQSPDDALFPSMPRNAISSVDADHVLTLAEIAPLLVRLAGDPAVRAAQPIADSADVGGAVTHHQSRGRGSQSLSNSTGDQAFAGNGDPSLPDDVEVDVDSRFVDGGAKFNEGLGGAPSGYTCPECHGALWELREGAMTRYRCRVGHSYSEPALLDHKSESLEAALWTALTALEESAAMARRMAERCEANGRTRAATLFDERADLLEQRSGVIRDVLDGIPFQAVAEEAVE